MRIAPFGTRGGLQLDRRRWLSGRSGRRVRSTKLEPGLGQERNGTTSAAIRSARLGIIQAAISRALPDVGIQEPCVRCEA